eukprot:TRINITY_DN13067_c1_g1_i1.p1 TRINITY_DN13067_c1_g1~~TRINITY_DN13067_c1_g1_i1.p1  ORF type:complete len:448 (+),score=130.20 TRINITY_DN13067_c1_g1_i1:79-1422(+)
MHKTVNEAVEVARRGYELWRGVSGIERGKKLLEVSRLIRSRSEELAQLECRDTNVAISEIRAGHITAAADCFEYFGCLAQTALQGTFMDLPHAGTGQHSFGYTRREPLGVCGGISAWNYPLMLSSWKAAPALACGNTMVLKPSELTPSTTLLLQEIICQAGIPEGVFQTVQGDHEAGAALCRHPGIAKISFTGSVETGRKVAAMCGEMLKPTTMELGGKSPLVIFKDAGLTTAVEATMLANFCNSGQACSNGTRVFVEEGFLEEYLEALLPRVEGIVVGDPFDDATQMGPLVSKAHRTKVATLIKTAMDDPQCQVLTGGVGEGLFVKPTVILSKSDETTVATTEIFGPVLTLHTFKTEEEAVQRANNTPYGLAGGVCSTDIRKAHRVAKDLEAGVTFINSYNICPVELPFGAFKQSGYGKENSAQAIHSYSQVKSVYVEEGIPDSGF